MKIAIVGPGIMSIPPIGWGAVEILIWDYKIELEKLGHEVLIVNTQDRKKIIQECNSFNPDFTHVQYDEFYDVCPFINGKVAITSHYGYIDQLHKNDHGYYTPIFNGFKQISACDKCYIFALSQSIKDMYVNNGVNSEKVFVTPNGAREDLFEFRQNCLYPDRSICVGKIEHRKRQELIAQYHANIYFAGNLAKDISFNSANYLGEWSKQTLYSSLTEYANLVLLSNGEADPLVVKEALMAGLGIVISEYATANLDTSLPFISVVSEMQIRNKPFVKYIIEQNREKSINMRKEIREYGIANFSWGKLVKNYVELIQKI